jgi:hypothetical protein
MTDDLAQTLMEEFARETGLEGHTPPRRYLWTDAFAVCNFVGLYRQTGHHRYLKLAQELVEQVHHVLGRHRDDDPRRGWISGLPEEEGEQHPTLGGLRIGKQLNERGPTEPPDSRLEWDRDGQYFHYLTKWMHALDFLGRQTRERRYQRWAIELAATAHRAFMRIPSARIPKQLVWKMSIDLKRPLVSSMGQHDPLDGLVTCLQLQAAESIQECGVDLAPAIADFAEMCAHGRWATDDPLGIGGLLDDASRLAQLVFERGVAHHELLYDILAAAEQSLQTFCQSSGLDDSAERRLAFRELGLAIGFHGLEMAAGLIGRDRKMSAIVDALLLYQPIAEQIQTYWIDPAHRVSRTWLDHREINVVMLATTLAPEDYLQL